MNQKEELIQIMLEIQNYLRHNNVNINAEEIYDSFRDYGLSEKEKNQPIPEAAKNDIRNILMRKADEGKCHYSGNPIDDIVHYEKIRLLDFIQSSNNPGDCMNLLRKWGISL